MMLAASATEQLPALSEVAALCCLADEHPQTEVKNSFDLLAPHACDSACSVHRIPELAGDRAFLSCC